MISRHLGPLDISLSELYFCLSPSLEKFIGSFIHLILMCTMPYLDHVALDQPVYPHSLIWDLHYPLFTKTGKYWLINWQCSSQVRLELLCPHTDDLVQDYSNLILQENFILNFHVSISILQFLIKSYLKSLQL